MQCGFLYVSQLFEFVEVVIVKLEGEQKDIVRV